MSTSKIALTVFLSLTSAYLSANSNTSVPKAHQPTQQAKANFVADFDQNQDDAVNRTEFDQVRASRFATMLDYGQGQVNAAAYQAEYADRLDRKLAMDRENQLKQTQVRFDALDKNKDQFISKAEFDATGERGFAYLDTDQNGMINAEDPAPTPRERPAASNQSSTASTTLARRAPNQTLRMPTTHNLAGMLAMYDQDQDGAVSKAEYLALRERNFAATDLDQDGKLSADEYLQEFVDRLDQQVAKVRAAELKQALVRFDALDKDKNQLLSDAEFQQSGERMFQRWDTSQDQIVTLSEALPKSEAVTKSKEVTKSEALTKSEAQSKAAASKTAANTDSKTESNTSKNSAQ